MSESPEQLQQKLSAKPASQEQDPELRDLHSWIDTETRRFITALNARQFDTLENEWSHLIDHTRFTGTIANHAPTLSWKEHIDTYRHGAKLEPDWHVRIVDLMADINDEEGTAEQYIFGEATGLSGGIRGQGLSVLSWRRKNRGGKWLCIKHTIIQQGLKGGL